MPRWDGDRIIKLTRSKIMIQTRPASNVGAYARSAAKAVRLLRDYAPLAQKAGGAVGRYFRGDVNQPKSANTTQQTRVMRPVRVGSRPRRGQSRGAASIVESGSLKLCDVTTSSTAAYIVSGAAVGSMPLRCDTIGGRLYEMSKLYSRWKFTRAVLRYVPAVSSATDGSLVIYYSQEPDDVYAVGESVGAGNATSAIDNMEFSVREKMNMPLHLNPQLLFTTQNNAEQAWHCAGVVNIISNGALVVSKTYGSIYIDFDVQFTQPCAPFDIFSPLHFTGGVGPLPHGAGAIGPGLIHEPIFQWTTDASLFFDKDAGPQWLIDPATDKLSFDGKIWLPPYSSVALNVTAVDTVGAAGNFEIQYGSGVQAVGTFTLNTATDRTIRYVNGTISNLSPVSNYFYLAAGANGFVLATTQITLTRVPFRGV